MSEHETTNWPVPPLPKESAIRTSAIHGTFSSFKWSFSYDFAIDHALTLESTTLESISQSQPWLADLQGWSSPLPAANSPKVSSAIPMSNNDSEFSLIKPLDFFIDVNLVGLTTRGTVGQKYSHSNQSYPKLHSNGIHQSMRSAVDVSGQNTRSPQGEESLSDTFTRRPLPGALSLPPWVPITNTHSPTYYSPLTEYSDLNSPTTNQSWCSMSRFVVYCLLSQHFLNSRDSRDSDQMARPYPFANMAICEPRGYCFHRKMKMEKHLELEFAFASGLGLTMTELHYFLGHCWACNRWFCAT